jgi:bacterioferritin-associated ferredoxin
VENTLKPTNHTESAMSAKADAMICYCYGLTASMLRDKHCETGSLKNLQKCTKAGTGCGGCRAVLHSMFDEEIEDMYENTIKSEIGTPCVKPGSRIMTSFVIANGEIESKIYSSNAVAPQLGDCDSTTAYDYVVLNQRGQLIYQKQGVTKTNETFGFDTRELELPRPFYGMFLLGLGRGNYGASRFNVQWGNDVSVTSTHEISVTGRPKVYIPVFVSKNFANTHNDIYLAIMNPREHMVEYVISVFDPNSNNKITWKAELGPYQSTWIDATEYLYKPALKKWPNDSFAIKVDTVELGHENAVSVYFFFKNTLTNQWSCQHL